MRILHVISSFDPALGGPPRIALRLAAGAAALGHEVTVLAYDKPVDAGTVPSGDLVKTETLPPPNRLERLFAPNAKKWLTANLPRFDIVQTHDIWDGLSRATVATAAKSNVPFAVLPNGMLDPWSLAQKKLKKSAVLAAGYRASLNRAAFFHVGNVDEEAGVRAAGITAPTEIIPNGVYRSEFDPLPDEGRFIAQHPKLSGRRFVLFLGRLHYKKGLDYLADAFAMIAPKFPDVDLVVAGPDDGAAEPFDERITDAGLADRVLRVGPIYGPGRFEAIVDAAVFCLPSRQEGFSIAILEALACGTPVVISEPCHFPQVGSADAGVVVPLTATAVAGGLERVLSDPRRMGENARRLVFDHYLWPDLAGRLVDAYGRGLARHASIHE